MRGEAEEREREKPVTCAHGRFELESCREWVKAEASSATRVPSAARINLALFRVFLDPCLDPVGNVGAAFLSFAAQAIASWRCMAFRRA